VSVYPEGQRGHGSAREGRIFRPRFTLPQRRWLFANVALVMGLVGKADSKTADPAAAFFLFFRALGCSEKWGPRRVQANSGGEKSSET